MEKEMYVKPSAEVVMYDSSDIIATRSGCLFNNYSGRCWFGDSGQGFICGQRMGVLSPDNGDSSFG